MRRLLSRDRLLAGTSLLAIMVAGSGAGATVFSFSGATVDFTVPTTGIYDITAAGAEGGSGGGGGATVSFDILLNSGDLLKISVGGAGGPAGYSGAGYSGGGHGGGGGGGGSFVFDSTVSAALAIAGGGGGGYSLSAGGPGLSTGTLAGGGSSYGGFGNGSGGSGGGGFTGGGGSAIGYGYGGGFGGGGFPGLAGGSGGFGNGGGGGFGGGGGGGGYGGGGGGGGTGGVGSYGSGGGGGESFLALAATDVTLLDGANAGDGSVTVTLETASAVPEPGSIGLLGAALAGFGLLRRRRRLG